MCFNGDIISSLDPTKLLEAIASHGGIGALDSGPWRIPVDSESIHTEGEIVTGFSEKPHPRELLEEFRTTGGYLINAGSYAFQPTIFDHLPDGPHGSLERHVFLDSLRSERSPVFHSMDASSMLAFQMHGWTQRPHASQMGGSCVGLESRPPGSNPTRTMGSNQVPSMQVSPSELGLSWNGPMCSRM